MVFSLFLFHSNIQYGIHKNDATLFLKRKPATGVGRKHSANPLIGNSNINQMGSDQDKSLVLHNKIPEKAPLQTLNLPF